MAIHHDDVSPILKERKKPSTVTMNIYITMTSTDFIYDMHL